MSLQIETPPTVVPQKQIAWHCIAPLTGDEISHASGLVKALYPSNTSLQFKVVTLQEPPKAEVLRYLEAEHSKGPLPAIERKAWINYYIKNTVRMKHEISSMMSDISDRTNSTKLSSTYHKTASREMYG